VALANLDKIHINTKENRNIFHSVSDYYDKEPFIRKEDAFKKKNESPSRYRPGDYRM